MMLHPNEGGHSSLLCEGKGGNIEALELSNAKPGCGRMMDGGWMWSRGWHAGVNDLTALPRVVQISTVTVR